MESKKIAHIGIAVKDLDESVTFYRDVLGLKLVDSEQAGELKAAFMKIGETHIESSWQFTTPEGVIAKFVAKKGEGVHHIAYEVEDIGKALADLEKNGTQFIDSKPRPGSTTPWWLSSIPSRSSGFLPNWSSRGGR